MRVKIMLPLLALIVMLGVPSIGVARQIHDFDCANCHKPNATLTSVGNIVCLDCHTGAMVGTTLPLFRTGPGDTNAISNATFATGDASDALGSVTAQGATPGDQNSHNWAAADTNLAAGATAPSNRRFYGRQNYSGRTVNCGRCHDPHGRDTNPKLLKLGTGTEAAMCNDCHVSWASDTAPSEGGSVPTNVHPMVSDYAVIAAAKPMEYNDVVALNATAGEVALNAGGGIDCLSCHGVHFTDSDSSTIDGAGQTLNPADGKILRANGASFDQANVAGASLCQACHKYKDHGTGRTNPIGCLVCHGAHLEDTGGLMNNYMLRSSITTKLPNAAGDGTVSGLVIDLSSGQTQSQRLWAYCFNCHDSGAIAVAHNSSWTCSDCHSHNDTDGSWSASGGCNTCHGYPPSENVKSDGAGGNAGYADGYELSGHFKDETNTQHVAHAGGGADYSFKCSVCHKNNDHIGANFADTFLAPMDPLVDSNGQLSSTYTAATGACSAVYCHSNGGPRGAVPIVNDPGVWEGGAAINTCDACHGNDFTDMATRNNSVSHINHLKNAGYSCQVCHADTAVDADTLAAGAIGGTHVDGTADVAFDGSSIGLNLGATSYGTDGTCSVYCHSNGTVLSAPDWDLPASGQCGSCHQADNDDTGTALSDPHSIHLFTVGGPQLYVGPSDYGCDNCHTNAGSGADHVNGSINLVAGACDACHGSITGGTGDDAEPNWAVPSSVSCETCHSGNAIANITGTVATPEKLFADTAGHGKISTPCLACHDQAVDSNHLGALNDTDRLRAGIPTYDPDNAKAFCDFCHGSQNNHFANSNSIETTDLSTDGNNCVICHDPHGQQDKNSVDLDAMLRATINGRAVTGFTDKTDRTKYYNTVDVGEGVCQTCHDPNEVNNFNRTIANTSHGGSGTCISCHPHTTTPAFKASCNGCHGDVATGQYWPFGSGGIIPTANDEVGEHAVHVLAISQRLGYGDIATLLAAADTDSKQKAICEYCHAGTSNDSDHGLVESLPADVFTDPTTPTTRHAKFLTGTDDPNAVYDNVADTCATVACHNGKTTVDNSYGWHDNADNPGCILCHNDITDTGIATGQTHSAHTGAAAVYGVTINCASCHDSVTNWTTKTKPASNHIDGNFDIGGTVALTYDGNLPTGSSFGSCGTNACHEDGAGNASVEEAGNGYTWGIAEASACGICHAAVPISFDHTIHLSSVPSSYGPKLADNCGACHYAGADNTSMAGRTTHINGTVTFADGGTPFGVINSGIDDGVNTIDTCDTCHGGATAANIAKGYWFTADRVTCESCHGDYALAEIGGVTAPSRAGSAYDTVGHGQAAFPTCNYCHNQNSDHISGSLNDANRLVVLGPSMDYEDPAKRNGYCNGCHTVVGAMNVHFDNDNTAGGTSTDGLYCVTCHDPHGQSGFDAMLKASVGGSTVGEGTQPVTGFTDRTDRTNYRNDSFTGVCQTCHADTEVGQFNQSTDNNAGHNPGANCIACHPHSAAPAFKASCNGCHGDATTGQYWPDGDADTQIPAVNDGAGRHEKHIEVLAQREYSQTIVQLLAAADTDTRQKALCAFCHDNPGADGDHATGTEAETSFHPIWDVSLADAGAAYLAGSCNSIACHNNKDTGTATYGWADSGTSACIMCHNDITSSANLTGRTHNQHMGASGIFGVVITCADCHAAGTAWGTPGTKPDSGHLDGTFTVAKSGLYPHFSYTGNWGQLGAGNQGTCGTNDCHNDGQMNTPYNGGNATYEWGDDVGFGCQICHNWGPNQPSTNAHVAHFAVDENFIASAISCSKCHNGNGMDSVHINQTINLLPAMIYRSGANSDIVTVGDAIYGSCNTTACHNNGRGTVVSTPTWDSTPNSGNNCTLCHGTTTGGMPGTGFHGAHAQNPSSPLNYTNTTGVASSVGNYDFGCGNCHSIALAQHLDGGVDVTLNSAHGGALKSLNSIANDTGGYSQSQGSSVTCSATYCHSYIDAGSIRQYVTTPDWYGSGFTGDSCASCHANSPLSNAHHEHEVGFHYDAVYSGLTGFLPVLDSDVVPAGLTYTDKDEIRGHGGRLADNITSTSTVMTCNVCHWSTVTNYFNDQNSTCATCHDGNKAPLKGDLAIADKRSHVNSSVEVVFFPQKVRSKAQLRDDLADVAEISNNWSRVNGYKLSDGSSYDEQPDTLANLSSWDSGNKTCTTSCHLWEANRVDKVPVAWDGGSIMCIDCHSRLPK